MFVPFGEYLPDLPAYQNPGVLVAKNVVPAGASYQPFLSQVVYSNALNARCQGAISTKDNAGNTINFAGDATKLYKSANATYSDVSKSGGYSTLTEDNWHFTRYGDLLIATNFEDYPQVFTLSSSSNFDNLTTDLKARYVATVRDFVVFGNTNDTVDGEVPNRVRWSAIGDPTDVTVSPVTQSGFVDMDTTYGWVRQIVGGKTGVVFQERAISTMDYVGSPTVFYFQVAEKGRGTQSPYATVQAGEVIFYLGIDGFYMFDGAKSIPIGENKINKTFFNEVDLNYLSRIYGTADFNRQIIYWLYPASGNSGGNGTKILCFNYSPDATKRWSYVDGLNLEFLYTSLSEGYTLDGLDALGYNLDTLPFSLDSRVWTGNNFLLSGFDSSHKQVNFTGSALTALIETQEAQLSPGMRSTLFSVRPMIDGSGTVTLEIGTRNLLSESIVYTSSMALNTIGEAEMRSNARYHRARVTISGGFNDAQGIDVVRFSPAGTR